MSLTRDDHSVEIGGHTVSVTGGTGPVHATWVLLIDGREADRARAAGDFTLRGELPDGSAVRAAVHQSLVGPTEVVVHHGDEEVARFRGFVA
ncbi:hypothetical protein HS048_26465 [Planomonospora sp. ID91781]|uniref:Uncharacterized protein n=1 Tax=Planomonospora sphaerica TaxID=161355 RepID=A0A171C129_9ACTN|nr:MULTISPECIES: hypothetical protein [Planomonospora]MBG0824257.1 hypothetical protein [Planomonospora sp. ID91781]GAT65924.1 hypothetical protein PS9374_01568 [Planomonospora sphaerica]